MKKTVNERLREEIQNREAIMTALVINEKLNRRRLDDLETRLKALDGKDGVLVVEQAKAVPNA